MARLFLGLGNPQGTLASDNRGLDQRPTSQDVRGFYPVTMMREPSMIVVIALSAALATPASAQTGNILNDNYSIMVPEKGSKQKVSKQKVSKPRAARTLACAEVPIAAWDRETRGHSEIEDRDPAKRRRSAGCFRSADGADVSEFADTRPGDRDFSRSRHTLQPPSWCLWPDRRRQRLLYGFLPLIADHRVGLRYRPRDESSTAHGKFPEASPGEFDLADVPIEPANVRFGGKADIVCTCLNVR